MEPEKSLLSRLPIRLIFLVLILVFGFEGFVLYKNFQGTNTPPPPQVENVSGGEIFLMASLNQMTVGQSTRVVVRLSTGGHSSQGADVILRYDPAIFEASTSSLYKGNLYPQYPIFDLDNKNGLIKISAIAPQKNKTFKGVGTFAMIDFHSRVPGESRVTVDFQKGSSSDSNIIEAGTSQDILEKVNSLTLKVLAK